MPGKKRLQYREALKALKEHVEAMDSSSPLPLKRFLIDFEVAVMSEIR
jgi:exonuclease VII small subunit